MAEKPSPLSQDDILIAEFNYIAQTAFQANEDRARVSSFYFVTVGSLVAAILSTQFAALQIQFLYFAFSGLFFFLFIMGILTVLQLARLRSAWFESVQAMNRIKDYYIAHHPAGGFEKAFLWRGTTAPPPFKIKSISFILTLEVAILSAVSIATSFYFFRVGFGFSTWPWTIILGIITLILFIGIYYLLSRPGKK